MFLYIVRHAWAFERDETEFPNDDLRPLTPKGEKRFRRVAKRLVKRGFAPAAIASSPLVRCRQTAEILVDRLPGGTKLEFLDGLAPGAHVRDVWNWLVEHADEDVALVGHAPDVSSMTAELIGGASRVEFAKGAVAAIEFEDGLDAGSGQLRWLATAEMLGC